MTDVAVAPPDKESPRLVPRIGLFLGLIAAASVAGFYFVYLNAVVDFRWDQKNDAISYMELTRRLAEDWSHPTRRWPPGMSLLFAPLFAAVGPNLTWIKAAVAMMGLATCTMLAVWVRKITGDGALAILSALLVATSWLFFDYSHRFLSEVPFAFWIMTFLLLIELTPQGRRKYLTLLAAFVAAMMVQLARGNGLILVPALAAAACQGGVTRVVPLARGLPLARLVLLTVMLPVPLVAWHVHTVRVHYVGFHGITQFEDVLTNSGGEMAAISTRHERHALRVSPAALSVRAYQNFAWGAVFTYPVTVYYPLERVLARARAWRSALLEWGSILPVWLMLGIGSWRMLRLRPLVVWLLVLNAPLVLTLPWPWGTQVRYLLPMMPLLTVSACLGLSQVIGRRAALLALGILVVLNVPSTMGNARYQAAHPFADPEFDNLLKLLRTAPAYLKDGERLVVDASVSGLAYAMTGAEEQLLPLALAEIGPAPPCAIFVASSSTPGLELELNDRLKRAPEATPMVLAEIGASRLIRVMASHEHSGRVTQCR